MLISRYPTNPSRKANAHDSYGGKLQERGYRVAILKPFSLCFDLERAKGMVYGGLYDREKAIFTDSRAILEVLNREKMSQNIYPFAFQTNGKT
eukprot:1392387-Amorphochlora_amoeboformis.AAC.1